MASSKVMMISPPSKKLVGRHNEDDGGSFCEICCSGYLKKLKFGLRFVAGERLRSAILHLSEPISNHNPSQSVVFNELLMLRHKGSVEHIHKRCHPRDAEVGDLRRCVLRRYLQRIAWKTPRRNLNYK